MTLNCETCGEIIEMDLEDYFELKADNNLNLDCGNSGCNKANRYTFTFTLKELNKLYD